MERVKYDRLEGYPAAATERVRTVLLTVWPSIPERVQDDLVLVGGLAVQLHMQGKENRLGRVSWESTAPWLPARRCRCRDGMSTGCRKP